MNGVTPIYHAPYNYDVVVTVVIVIAVAVAVAAVVIAVTITVVVALNTVYCFGLVSVYMWDMKTNDEKKIKIN